MTSMVTSKLGIFQRSADAARLASPACRLPTHQDGQLRRQHGRDAARHGAHAHGRVAHGGGEQLRRVDVDDAERARCAALAQHQHHGAGDRHR